MDKEERYERAIHDFAAMLYRKGYRARYTMKSGGSSVPVHGPLSECLTQLLGHYDTEEKQHKSFELKTHPPYNDNLQCSFRIKFDEAKGFLVREMDIVDSVSKQNRHYRIDHNHIIPGANAIGGLFPKKKPWDDFLKGKFRP